MTSEVLNYKCPCCGAPLAYNGGSGKLKCASCGNDFELESVQQAQEVMENTAASLKADWKYQGSTWEGEGVKSYICPSCGAEIVADDTTAATECVYCGNATVLQDRLSAGYRPDGVIPFVRSVDDAKKAYQNLIQGKPLLPKEFIAGNRIEKITGVYVPYWMFDCDTDADISFNAERRHVHRQGKYEVTDIDHYLVLRSGTLGFDGVPVDGSSKFDDTLMEAIEPFDSQKEAAYSSAYLPGFQAERYDVDAEAAKPRADERVRTSVEDAFRGTVAGYDSVSLRSSNVRIFGGRVRNVLAPVYMLNTKWQDKTYTFAMNGQTGKLVGDLPISKKRLAAWGLGLFAGIFAAGFGLMFLLYTLGVI